MGKIFGGSKSKQQSTSTSVNSSSNLAYPWLKEGVGQEALASYTQGSQALSRLLGGGFEGYKDNIGYDFQENMGRGSILGNMAGRGTLQSGAALKGLTEYSSNLASTTFDDYLTKLFQQSELGLGGLNLIGGTGGVSSGTSNSQSTGSSSSSKGIGKFLGTVLGAAAASDPRLKKNVFRIGDVGEVGLYQFRYINDAGPYIGVMADEVRDTYPEALGPEVGGYLTVDYGKLEEIVNG